MNNFSRNIVFKSTSSDYELLRDENIKSAIKFRLGISTDDAYEALLTNGIANMGFCVFANTRISINGEPYSYNEPIMNVVSGNGEVNEDVLIKSIKIENNKVSGTFYFKI